MDRIKEFINELANTKVPPNVYNQYQYGDPENEVRRDNLYIYLQEMYRRKPRILLVAEAPGYRGSRITGVPFTSEDLLMNNIEGLKLFGKEASYRLPVEKKPLIKEATATIVRETLVQYNIEALGWNAFPFHPHKKGNLESNRTPLKKELEIGKGPLLKIIDIFSIKEIIAVGRKAEESLQQLNIAAHRVRHPAQGGKVDFVEGIKQFKEKNDKSLQ